jgi:tetratricopeptide (TPR) repeat protein
MGGQGKTQLALEYCRIQRNISDIFWIDATSESTLKAQFALLSNVLDPAMSPTLDTEARVSNLRRKVAERTIPWLMVFDNYDDPQSYNIRKFIPDSKLGMVIITSRHKDSESLTDQANRIELNGLNETEAVELLFSESETDPPLNVSTPHATAIVSRLGYHPLAIAQAGAYISMRNLKLEDFLDHYNQRQAVILKRTTPLMSEYWKKVDESGQEVPMNVFTTCELSYRQLLSLEDAEQRHIPDLLTLLAFFDSQDVSESFLKAFSRPRYHYPEIELPAEYSLKPDSVAARDRPGSYLRQFERNWDQASYHDALLVLKRLSLVEFSTSSRNNESPHASLHPLVRDWLRLRTPKQACIEYTSLVGACIYMFLASTRDWSSYQLTLSEKQQLIAHINAYSMNIALFGIAHKLGDLDIPSYDKGLPVYEFSKFLYQNGMYRSSAEWSWRSLDQRIKQFGPDAYETLATKTGLAGAFYAQGEHHDAKQIYIEIIEVKERMLGSKHPETLLSKVNLAPLLASEGQYETAETIYRHVLKWYKKMLGEADPNTIIAMGGLGSLLNTMKNYIEAEELNRQALGLATGTLGLVHVRTLSIMEFLGVSLAGLGRLEEAREIFQKALQIRETESGMEHPDTIMCMRSLMSVLDRQEMHSAAEKLRAHIVAAKSAGPWERSAFSKEITGMRRESPQTSAVTWVSLGKQKPKIPVIDFNGSISFYKYDYLESLYGGDVTCYALTPTQCIYTVC